MRKPWSMHKRKGIYQTQLYDYTNKKYLTAKSTGTKDRNEAMLIAYRRAMEFDSGIAVEYTEWAKNVAMITLSNEKHPLNTEMAAMIQTACQDAVAKTLQTILYNKNTEQPYSVSAAEYEDAPEEAKLLLDQLSTLTFYDYTQLYWDYDKSPHIQGFIRRGETPPNPERFHDRARAIKKYAKFFPQCLLTEITGAKIDTLLGAIKKEGNLKDSTMKVFRYIFSQALSYAYQHNLITRDVAHQISRETKSAQKKAKKEAEKAIFTKEELHRLFNNDDNPFVLEVYQLLNELLFKTGCRIGELQALQIQDVIKTENGYSIKVDKNYSRSGKRIKCTKTERTDMVPISDTLAAKLVAHIEKHPLKDKPDAFIFFSAQNIHSPMSYTAIRKNFIATMETLNFTRPNLTLHSYRHTYATFLLMAGFSEKELKVATRHDCIAEVWRYADHYTPEIEQLKHRAIIALDTMIS
ncbi:MAG: tyrosine-type recombinase/integrase [Treponema sp.]|uniref:tyrosine-type recombinase/integrase n=1 Tax=Treponema sp. TaxID=166 RepID=UPI003FA21087